VRLSPEPQDLKLSIIIENVRVLFSIETTFPFLYPNKIPFVDFPLQTYFPKALCGIFRTQYGNFYIF